MSVSVVAKRLNGSICHLVRRKASVQATLRYIGDPAAQKGAQPSPIFGPCLLWPNGRPSQLVLSTCYIYLKLGNSYRTNRNVIIQYLVLQCSLHNDYKYTVSGKSFSEPGRVLVQIKNMD